MIAQPQVGCCKKALEHIRPYASLNRDSWIWKGVVSHLLQVGFEPSDPAEDVSEGRKLEFCSKRPEHG